MESFKIDVINIPVITNNMEQNQQAVEEIRNKYCDKRITVTTKVVSIVTVIGERTT